MKNSIIQRTNQTQTQSATNDRANNVMFINANNVEVDRNQRKAVFVVTSEEEDNHEMSFGQEVIEEDLEYQSEEEKKEIPPAQSNASTTTDEQLLIGANFMRFL